MQITKNIYFLRRVRHFIENIFHHLNLIITNQNEQVCHRMLGIIGSPAMVSRFGSWVRGQHLALMLWLVSYPLPHNVPAKRDFLSDPFWIQQASSRRSPLPSLPRLCWNYVYIVELLVLLGGDLCCLIILPWLLPNIIDFFCMFSLFIWSKYF